ncbi:MAG: hypothetical protein NT007_13740 [Candidatus Kapabacteria bacterium]|nr:hypothetical protein [Candidatus Kapabacteria bacterium]
MKTFPKPTVAQTQELLRWIPKRPCYSEWIIVIAAIANTFEPQLALRILTSYFIEEKKGEHWYQINNGLKNITYGSLIHLAKKYGFRGINSDSDGSELNSYNKEFCYEFNDLIIAERAFNLRSQNNLTKAQSDTIIKNQFSDAAAERIYRCCVNYSVIDKNIDPVSKKSYKGFKEFTNNFENTVLSDYNLAYCIGCGYSIILSEMKADEFGKVYRKSGNWSGSELVGIDIDAGMTITAALEMDFTWKSLLLYTTVSHKIEENRFRIIFALPFWTSYSTFYKKNISVIMDHYPNCDRATKDVCRAFYGNTNSTIYLFSKGLILNFQNGMKESEYGF